jgi:arsenate reductase
MSTQSSDGSEIRDIVKQKFDSRSEAGAERRTNHAQRPYVVLFACVHNAGRSQMAAALLNRLADPAKARAISAGTQPAERVHPVVAEVMREVGIDLSEAQPQRLTTELAAQADLLITMGCGEECPVIPGLRRDDWPLSDPKGQPIARVREIRDEVRARVEQFLFRQQG